MIIGAASLSRTSLNVMTAGSTDSNQPQTISWLRAQSAEAQFLASLNGPVLDLGAGAAASLRNRGKAHRYHTLRGAGTLVA